ncbi:MAG: glutamyl-tRNA(Gln) amidotransferase [Rhizobiales bacterium PAR1]|nr:MAG: glutamyl-tRNA(Gln) amidotransferase [Rhizobiales bacterium PAR1]
MKKPTPNESNAFNAFVERFDSFSEGEGPLEGLTFAAKDCLDLAGRAPGCGLPSDADLPAPASDAAIIRMLQAAGAHLLGMTQMTALAYEPSGTNAALGRPVNPLNSAYVCGGSSSGSAVAVAAGAVDFAIGTDTGGSVRIPAHCCGISAWKPSFGLIPVEGVMPLAPSLDVVGFLAPEAADFVPLIPVLIPSGAREMRFRSIAFALDVAAEAPHAAEALESVLKAARHTGFTCHDTEALPLIRDCDPPVMTLMQGEAYRAHAARIASGSLDPVMAKRLGKGAEVSESDLAAARAALTALSGETLDAVFGPDDILLLPVMPCETPRVALCDPGSPEFSARALYALSAFTRFANGLGLPVVTLATGKDSHEMPIGLQLVARPGRDADLIRAAATIERALDLPTLRPLIRRAMS